MKILIYTDSRGDKIRQYQNHIHYTEKIYRDVLQQGGECEVYLCPEKWTTTMDFFRTIEGKDLQLYDWIILQTSVVENSPRHKNDAYGKIYLDVKKKPYFDKIFGEDNMIKHFKTDFGKDYYYENVPTTNMFSLKMAIDHLIPKLEKINNLIWVSNCPLVGGDGQSWKGTYWKDRPKNIGIVNDYSKEYIKNMVNTKVIDTTNWNDSEIQKYTVDNMHYTKEGSDYIFEEIRKIYKKKK